MTTAQPPTILAIDTSCDETAVALTHGRTVWANCIASQIELHAPYGGVFPTIAKQAHRTYLPATVAQALKRARVGWPDVTAIAVTQGPGLAPALEVGITYARQLAQQHHLPLIPVNHLEGHLLSVVAEPRPKSQSLPPTPATSPPSLWPPTPSTFPILGLIISGGHTEFVLITAPDHYQKLGWTIDDAAGEVLDKVGRMLHLGYPAGPVVDHFARSGDPRAFTFPLPMTTSGDFNLSFSGLKTFSRNTLEKIQAQQELTPQLTQDFCASLQQGVFRAITYKLTKLLEHLKQNGQLPHQVWLGGGVAANSVLRSHIRACLRPFKLRLRTPYTLKLCGDNAAMIGVAAAEHWLRSSESIISPDVITSDTGIDRRPRWPIDQP